MMAGVRPSDTLAFGTLVIGILDEFRILKCRGLSKSQAPQEICELLFCRLLR